ncbi:MAG: oligosaccharide flippase family protein, partial [Kangiellaceae bacterium]|nr:oligosaccharide flippase family protein [Kangiellaceae bacterium]
MLRRTDNPSYKLPRGGIKSGIWRKVCQKLYALRANRFLKNAGWISACELFNRLTRLVTAIVLARYLSPLEFGVAAIALTANDLIKVLAQNGVGAKIVQATEEELESVCQAAYKTNWLFCGGLFLLQNTVAILVAVFYQDTSIGLLIACLSLVYLVMPFGLVQAFLLYRANKLKITAAVSAVQTSLDNVITIFLALAGLGIWAIVLPKVLVAPVWLYGILSNQRWNKDSRVAPAKITEILHFGKNILGTEVCKALRLYADNLMVALFLGVEAAGIYFFAKNAGLGISLSFINAFNHSLFSHLCDIKNSNLELKNEFIRTVKITLLFLLPIIILQGGLAHWYVPIVFGEQWSSATSVLML